MAEPNGSMREDGEGVPAEPRGATLVETLVEQAALSPGLTHLVLLDEKGQGGPARTLTFSELLEGALGVAQALGRRGLEPGQTVGLMLPTCREFFFGFLGTLAAGGVPVPIYPPLRADQIEEYVERQSGILRNAEVRLLLTFRQAAGLARLLRPRVPTLRAAVEASHLVAEGAGAPERRPAAVAPQDLALLQYTSGSTGEPKGVALTHANLLANIRAIGEAVEVRSDDVVVSWLPLYHDMGLIGCWLFALVHGLPIISLSPLAFLRRPVRWLRALADHRGTLSPAPNFAYQLCVRRVHDRELEGLDLSSWRMALNGAEAVHPETLEAFAARFAPYGFRPEAMKPVYGLAESTVALSFPPLGSLPRIDTIDRDTFQRRRQARPVAGGRAGEEADGAPPLRFVGVGSALAGHATRVVDEHDRPLPERREGEIQFRGPSTTRGYHRNPEATAAIRTADGWTRTGDLGYAAEGDLFITGRSKDLIVKAGRNVYPPEVEEAAGEVAGVRRGCVVAFGVANPESGSDDLVVVVESRLGGRQEHNRLAAEVRRRVRAGVGVAADDVRVVPPGTVAKTPSGKLRRLACRDRYLAGTLAPGRRPAWVQLVRLAVRALGGTVAGWVRRPRRPSPG